MVVKRMTSNHTILQAAKEVLESYDELESGDEKLVEMDDKSTHIAITSILMIPAVQKRILSKDDIFKRYAKALITIGRSAWSKISLYKDSSINRNFIDRFKVQDQSGHDLFIGGNDFSDIKGNNNFLDSEADDIFQSIDSQNNEGEASEHPPVSDEDGNKIDRQG